MEAVSFVGATLLLFCAVLHIFLLLPCSSIPVQHVPQKSSRRYYTHLNQTEASPLHNLEARFVHPDVEDSKYLTAVVHSGPHKTGTTSLQNQLANNLPYLQRNKYDYPSAMRSKLFPSHFTVDPSVQRQYMYELRDHADEGEHTLRDFVDHSSSEQHNVILSSENFIELSLEELKKMNKLLQKFEKKIVVLLYRDQLTRTRSRRYEHMEHLEMKEPPFMTYLETKFDYFVKEFTDSMDAHISVFGEENVHLVDYEGLKAAGKDEAFVVFCEIIGILCEETSRLNKRFHANVSPSSQDLHPRMVLDYMESKAIAKGCRYFSIPKSEQLLNVIKVSLEAEAPKQLPSRQLSLDHYLNLTRIDEANVRKRYSDIIMYGNPAAVEAARGTLSHEEVDFAAMEASSFWSSWLSQLEIKFNFDACHSRAIHV